MISMGLEIPIHSNIENRRIPLLPLVRAQEATLMSSEALKALLDEEEILKSCN